MDKYSIGLSIVVLLAGCAAPQKPLTGASAELEEKSLVVVNREMPMIDVTKAGTAALGMTEYDDSAEITKMAKDPADIIAENISAKMIARYRSEYFGVGATPVSPKEDKVDVIARSYKADLALDVRTTGWQMVYFSTDWSHYRIFYNARMRLIDLPKSIVLAEGGCHRDSGEMKDIKAPTYEELTQKNGEVLNKILDKLAASCTEELWDKYLKL